MLQVEHGTFTLLVMSTTGGMGRESRKFYAHLSEIISEKRKENYAFIASWIRRKLTLALANSLCIFYVVVDLFIALQTQTQRICCIHLQRLAKLHKMLVQLYYPFEFHILHILHATFTFECTIVMRKYDKTEF